jgi:hypothetical protein
MQVQVTAVVVLQGKLAINVGSHLDVEVYEGLSIALTSLEIVDTIAKAERHLDTNCVQVGSQFFIC